MASNVGTVNVTLLVAKCKDCKSWDAPDVKDREPFRGHCKSPKVGGALGEDDDGAMDNEAYGGIDTGPDFGCVHWEAK
jgi:hypothetical protein